VRPNTAPQCVPDGPVRVEFEVQFSRGPKGRRRVREAQEAPAEAPIQQTRMDTAPRPAPLDPNSVPRITRLFVLGYHFERLVRGGVVKNYAEIARLTGLSRARVTQIVNLTLLAPGFQEDILLTCGRRARSLTAHEKTLRGAVTSTCWH